MLKALKVDEFRVEMPHFFGFDHLAIFPTDVIYNVSRTLLCTCAISHRRRTPTVDRYISGSGHTIAIGRTPHYLHYHYLRSIPLNTFHLHYKYEVFFITPLRGEFYVLVRFSSECRCGSTKLLTTAVGCNSSCPASSGQSELDYSF
jgi:hypothetical protein